MQTVNRHSTWRAQPNWSVVEFSIPHGRVGVIKGRFLDFTIQASTDGDGSIVAFDARLGVASITTGDDIRDTLLMTMDYFDVRSHPSLTFRATSTSMLDADASVVNGRLRVNGRRTPLRLDVTTRRAHTEHGPVLGLCAIGTLPVATLGFAVPLADPSRRVTIRADLELHPADPIG